MEFAMSALPGLALRGQALGVLRANGRLLFGGDWFWLGPFGDFESLAPQVIDTAYGGALRIGHEYYVEAQFGSFRREFHQPGSENLSGKGFAANLIYGQQLSPHFGVDIALTAKRISSGTLDKRWIVDLLPLLSVRGDF